MRLLHSVVTPWSAVYSVTFSRDGSRLAIGGGTWYGGGGIMLFDLRSGASESMICSNLPYDESTRAFTRYRPGRYLRDAPTVSGLCFSDNDLHLAASMWGSGQSYEPSAVFGVCGVNATYSMRCPARDFPFRRPCPTGVLLYRSKVITRSYRADPEQVIVVDPIPEAFHVAADQSAQRFTHSRMIVTRGSIITESGGRRGPDVPQPDGSRKRPMLREGLVLRSLAGEAADHLVPVERCRRVTAIALGASDDEFVTGGLDGELDRWSWDGCWKQTRLRSAQEPRQVEWKGIDFPVPWVTYSPISVVALASLCLPETWASVNAGGELTLWMNMRAERVEPLPEPGSPRALAAHHTMPWLAVGLKQGSIERSAVLIIEVD